MRSKGLNPSTRASALVGGGGEKNALWDMIARARGIVSIGRTHERLESNKTLSSRTDQSTARSSSCLIRLSERITRVHHNQLHHPSNLHQSSLHQAACTMNSTLLSPIGSMRGLMRYSSLRAANATVSDGASPVVAGLSKLVTSSTTVSLALLPRLIARMPSRMWSRVCLSLV